MTNVNEDEYKKSLKACPFCNAGETHVEAKRHWGPINRPSEIISVVIRHHCTKLPGPYVTTTIEVRGRDYETAREGWNRRPA